MLAHTADMPLTQLRTAASLLLPARSAEATLAAAACGRAAAHAEAGVVSTQCYHNHAAAIAAHAMCLAAHAMCTTQYKFLNSANCVTTMAAAQANLTCRTG